MDIFTGQVHKSGTLIRVIKVIVLYLILINSSNYSARKNHNLNSNFNQLPQENMNIHCSLINNLDEKVLLDLSKNDLLSLLNKDSIIFLVLLILIFNNSVFYKNRMMFWQKKYLETT